MNEPSVTSIISLRAIPGLSWGAAKEVALHAVDWPEKWRHLDRDEAVDYLRRTFQGVWDGRAAMGSAVHAVMQAWVAGETVDLAKLVEQMAADRQAKSWLGHEDWATQMLGSYVEGLEKFWNDHRVQPIGSEEVVRTPGLYIGTRDLLANLGEELWLLDIKTTSELDSEKGIYHQDWAMQLAAYNFATEVVAYEDGAGSRPYASAKGRKMEIGTEPNEPADRCGIIHLRGDGDYTLYEVEADHAALDAFLALAAYGRWDKSLGQPHTVKQ